MKPGYSHAMIVILISIIFSGCNIWSQKKSFLPPINKPSYLELNTENKEQFRISLKNNLAVDRFVILRSSIDSLQAAFDEINPIILSANDSLSYTLFAAVDTLSYDEMTGSISGSSFIGNPATVSPDTSYLYTLPVKKGRPYRILQGQKGSFTHNKVTNKYAVDFAMAVGDTVYAARGGTVAYLFEESSLGGNDPRYLSYSNTVMILHEDGTVAQYSHLKKKGVLVEIGDLVKEGQPIALSGNTGYVSGDHLHLNVFKPTESEPVSIFFSFKGYENKRFVKGDRVFH